MNIAVYGSSGHAARFVIAELLRRGHTPIAIGRDGVNIATAVAVHAANVETRIATLDSAESLDRALSGADAVIHCAGPYLETAQPVIAAALRCRLNYFDLTAEQSSARSTFEMYDAAARERGVIVVPAAGFYGGFGDLLATHAMNDWAQADQIDIAIALDRWWPTRGTRQTGTRNTAPRLTLSDGRLSELQPETPRTWPFPAPFGSQEIVALPFTETILIARHLRVRELRNYLNAASLRDVSDPATPEPVPADERGRSNQQFIVDVVVRSADEERRVAASGRDIYATTAPIVVEAVERLCAGREPRAGAFALGQLVNASEFLESLARSGEIALRDRRERSPRRLRE